MKYRRFGRTGLQMPVLTCGGMRFQHKWSDVDPKEVPTSNQENLRNVIDRALELGINHIETARGYGSSEMQLGWILPKLSRERLIVQTKVAPTEDPAEFIKTFEISMERLGLDHVDLFSLHGVNNQEVLDWSLRKGGCMEAARKFQSDGRVRFIGFSTHASPEVITSAIRSGEFDYVNLHWYFVNDLNRTCIDEAAKQDMGMFIISPNDKGGKLYAPPDSLRELCEPLSPMAFNDLYCLRRPDVHTLSIGASKPGDFDEHIAALAFYDRIDEVVPPIEQRLRDRLNERLGAEWCEYWFENLPEHYHLPGDLNVREILRLWTYARGLDLTDWGKMRYNLLGNAGHWFPGQNAATLDEEALRPLLEGNRFADRIPGILKEAHTLLHDAPVKRVSESD